MLGALENPPEGHAVHVVAPLLTAPVPVPISATKPAPHALQSAVDALEYIPEPHAVHADAPLPTAPVPAPISATDPAAHARQLVVDALEYVPAPHGVHVVPPSGAHAPTLHDWHGVAGDPSWS